MNYLKLLTIAVILSIGFLSSGFVFNHKSTIFYPKRNHEIFGEEYEEIDIISQQLAGHVYYIISGHGGPDPGAMCTVNGRKISEDEYAYDVSLRLARNLLKHSAKVYMIVKDQNDGIRDDSYLSIDNDEVVHGNKAIPLNQSTRLKQRTDVINNLSIRNKRKYKVQRAIEIHVDSRSQDHKVDVFFYYNSQKAESKKMAQSMFDVFKKKYDAKQVGREYNGEIKARNLWMITQCVPPMTFIELGNITNEFDRKRIMIADNRQALANWMAEGILDMR